MTPPRWHRRSSRHGYTASALAHTDGLVTDIKPPYWLDDFLSRVAFVADTKPPRWPLSSLSQALAPALAFQMFEIEVADLGPCAGHRWTASTRRR